MFESIVYKNSVGPGPLIDIGALAEGLLFYGRVAIVGNTATINDLLARIPPFIFLSLLKDGRIEFYYQSDQIGVSTNPAVNGRVIHNLVSFSSPEHTIQRVAPESFKKYAGDKAQAILGASRFSKLLRPIDHATFDHASILEAICDKRGTQSAVTALIHEIMPSVNLPEDSYFRIERESNGLYVDTNIDFDKLNNVYHQSVPSSHSSLSEAYLLALIQGAYESTYFAATLDAEIAVHPIEKSVQAKEIEAIVLRHKKSQEQIESFTDLTLSSSHAIREAINSGAVPFSSMLKLLDSADKFRHWLHQQPPDANLLRTYYEETVKESWVEKLPAKSTRWGIFTSIGLGLDALGLGGLGTAGGIALSVVDSFILDKLLKGWKPHQFIEKNLKSLLLESSAK